MSKEYNDRQHKPLRAQYAEAAWDADQPSKVDTTTPEGAALYAYYWDDDDQLVVVA